MFLDIRELERDGIAFEEQLLPGRIDLGKEVSQVERLEVRGSAALVARDIHLQGLLRTTVQVSCARCLEPALHPVEIEFDLLYRPIQTIARAEEVEIKPSEMEVGFYHGNGLWLEDAVKEQILLALPMKSICRPDCAGLCPQCGQNRNHVACQCRPSPQEARWAPLAGFKG